jgi:predicted FMN-binding regulatory protein PaiB
MRQQIVAYEMTIEKVEAKFKLGQERTAADRAGVLQGLERPQGRSLYELTRDYYARLQG